MEDVWSRVKGKMKLEISNASYLTWVESTTANLDGDILTVYCVNDFQRNWLEKYYKNSILHTLKKISGQSYELLFEETSNNDVIPLHEDSDNTMVIQQPLEEKVITLEKTIENLQNRLLVIEEKMEIKN